MRSGDTLLSSTRAAIAGPWAHAIVAWGVLGVLALIAQAIWRLAPLALEPIAAGTLTPPQVVLYGLWVILNAYAEGYRGFHKRFSPRVVARALHLAQNPRTVHVLVAPLFCMSLFHATTRGKLVAWGITLGVITLVLLVRAVPQPWRGIIDGGVVIGLLLGGLSILYYLVQAFGGREIPAPSDLPAA